MSGGRKQGFKTYDEFQRALDLVAWLQSGERVNAVKIAERYEICRRTAQRLMASAKLALPVRVWGGRGDGGEIMVWQGERLPR